jgi:hypothetical protein
MRPKFALVILQAVVLLTGIAAAFFLLWEPHLEGRNANATLFSIYFKDPFLAFAYFGSISFFVALYQVFKILGNLRHAPAVSQTLLKRLRLIKNCAFILIGFVAVGEVVIVMTPSDDRAGGVFMGVLVVIAALILAIAAIRFERLLRSIGSPPPKT